MCLRLATTTKRLARVTCVLFTPPKKKDHDHAALPPGCHHARCTANASIEVAAAQRHTRKVVCCAAPGAESLRKLSTFTAPPRHGCKQRPTRCSQHFKQPPGPTHGSPFGRALADVQTCKTQGRGLNGSRQRSSRLKGAGNEATAEDTAATSSQRHKHWSSSAGSRQAQWLLQ